jgi:hypothetical protein
VLRDWWFTDYECYLPREVTPFILTRKLDVNAEDVRGPIGYLLDELQVPRCGLERHPEPGTIEVH